MNLVTMCLFGTNLGYSDGGRSVGQNLVRKFNVVDTKSLLGIVGVEFARYAQPR